MIPLTSSEIEHIAAVSAEAAVRKVLLTMGVDTSDDKAMLEMQKDFAHVRTWRAATDTVKRQTLLTAIGIVVSGIAGALWMAFGKGH